MMLSCPFSGPRHERSRYMEMFNDPPIVDHTDPLQEWIRLEPTITAPGAEPTITPGVEPSHHLPIDPCLPAHAFDHPVLPWLPPLPLHLSAEDPIVTLPEGEQDPLIVAG